MVRVLTPGNSGGTPGGPVAYRPHRSDYGFPPRPSEGGSVGAGGGTARGRSGWRAGSADGARAYVRTHPVDDVVYPRTGKEHLVDALRLELRGIFLGDDAAAEDPHVPRAD